VLVTWAGSLAAAQSYKPDRTFYNYLTLEMEAMFIIELIFLAVGLLLGCVMKRYKLSGSTAIGIILVTYFLSVASGMQQNLDFLKYLSPFKYFDSAQLLQSGRIDGVYLLLSAAIIAVSVAVAYWIYNKRDLYI
jgi:ABC-2 type transport system permease protein